MPWERDGKVKLYPLQSTFPQHQLRHAGKLAVFGCCCCCLHHPQLKLKNTHTHNPTRLEKMGGESAEISKCTKKFVATCINSNVLRLNSYTTFGS